MRLSELVFNDERRNLKMQLSFRRDEHAYCFSRHLKPGQQLKHDQKN